MSKPLKRRGKTFITEAYAPVDMCNALHKAFMEHAASMEDSYIRALIRTREISVWADPRGIFFYFGQGRLPYQPVPWSEFPGLTREDISTILFGMMKCFQDYGDECKDRQFKVILNDKTVNDIIIMMEL